MAYQQNRPVELVVTGESIERFPAPPEVSHIQLFFASRNARAVSVFRYETRGSDQGWIYRAVHNLRAYAVPANQSQGSFGIEHYFR
ncbi:MAG TPA: hypothetical protein VJS37_10465 [Terriglobales bacterium]|nr:hypothetical protein [Terriglobales bacterium]